MRLQRKNKTKEIIFMQSFIETFCGDLSLQQLQYLPLVNLWVDPENFTGGSDNILFCFSLQLI